MNIPIILDFIVVALLFGTIFHAVNLNRKLGSIYESRGELQQFLTSFTTSLTKAEQSMEVLKGTGETAFAIVQEHMKQASALRDDLGFLVERGESIASRLDESIRHARSLQKDIEEQTRKLGELRMAVTSCPTPSNQEEPDLVQALKNVR